MTTRAPPPHHSVCRYGRRCAPRRRDCFPRTRSGGFSRSSVYCDVARGSGKCRRRRRAHHSATAAVAAADDDNNLQTPRTINKNLN